MMHELFELIPILCGVAIGILCGRIKAGFRRCLALVLLGIGGGLAATFLSGEYQQSWGYLLLDIPLTIGMAAATLLTLRAVAKLSQSMWR